MVYKYQCDIDKQNCNDIYPQGLTAYPYDPVTVFFNNQSCVRDQRLEGNVGRCGFPGASCIVNVSTSNCATGMFSPLLCTKSFSMHNRSGGDMSCRNLSGVCILWYGCLPKIPTHLSVFLIGLLDIHAQPITFVIVRCAIFFRELAEIWAGGVRCNVTFDNGICGGSGAYMANAEAADGLDFGRDYCASGQQI